MAHPLWGTNGGINIGFPRLPGEAIQLRRELTYTGDRHLICFGPNGSGKTRRLALIALCRLLGWSLVVVDTKGSLAAMTYELREKHGCHNYIFNPGDMLGMGTNTHNPIAGLDPASDYFIDDVNEHAETIITIDEDTKEKHWPESGQDLFAGIEMYVATILKGSMADVRNLLSLSDADFRKLLTVTPFHYEGADHLCVRDAARSSKYNLPEMWNKLARFEDMKPDDRELHGVFRTTLTQTRSFDSRPLKRVLSGKAVDFSKLKERPSTVYLVVPPRRLQTYAKWLRLMVASILQALMNDVKEAAVPVMFIFDEAYALLKGGFKIVEDLYAQVREFGLKFWFLFQDLAQMITLYGEPGFETYIENAGVVQFFAPQGNCTADYASRLTGHDTKYALSGSGSRTWGSGGVNISRSASVSQIDRALMLPQEIREMDNGQTIAFSHEWKGTALPYLPYPSELPWMQDVMRLDPARR